jgi:hypothetical protein
MTDKNRGKNFVRRTDLCAYNRVVGDPSGREADFRRLHLLADQHSLTRQLSNFFIFIFSSWM